MPGFASLALRVGLLVGLALVASRGEAPAQERVGVNSAVNPEARGTPPGGTTRRLVIGQPVVYNEHITTSTTGQTQLLFLDESSMTIGPNSDLMVDQFVYDPKSGTGKLAMSATRGLLRYVGGKLSKQDDAVTLKTSTATLAVRGGAFIVNIASNGTTTAVFIYGNGLTVTSNSGGTQTITRPGYETSVSPGQPPTPPSAQPPGQLAQFLSQLDGRTGGTGGASTTPNETMVVNSGIGNVISGSVAASIQQAVNESQRNGTQRNNPGNNGFGNGIGGTSSIGGGLQQQVQNSNLGQLSCSNCSSSGVSQIGQVTGGGNNNNNNNSNNNGGNGGNGNGGNNGGGTTPPAGIIFSGRVKNTNGNGTARGFFDQTANGDIAYANGSLSQGTFTGAFNNNGANLGTLTFPLISGSATFSGSSSTLGPITGTSFLAADNSFFYATITPTNSPSERLFVYGGTPVNTSNSTVFNPTGSTRIFAFTVQPDAALQATIPFVRGQAGGNLPNASVSPLYAVAPASTPIGNATSVVATRALQASLAVNGQGANQQSAIAVTTGTVSASAGGQPQLLGAMRGSSQLSATNPAVRLSSAVSSTLDGNGGSFYGPNNGNSISGFVLDQTQYNSGATTGTAGSAVIPSTANELPLSGGATTYGFTHAAVPSAVPAGVGTNRTTQAMTGSFAGLMSTTAQPNPYAVLGSALVATDAGTNRVQATLAGNAQTASSGVNNVTIQYGGLTGDAGGRQAFIDNNTFAALESQTNPQQINGQNLVVNGDATQAGRVYLASSGAAGQPTQLLSPSGASFCQCQYLKWGYWGGDLRTGNASNANISRIDRGHINTWVVGTPTPAADLNSLISQSATATYTGAAIGSVFNNGASYMAAGGFRGTYNFGTQSGSMAITNFDGRSFAASGRAPLSGANYTFPINNSAVTGSVNGTFYGPGAAETGGSFAVHTNVGPTYIATGTYAGKR
jgi:hypothetical protein